APDGGEHRAGADVFPAVRAAVATVAAAVHGAASGHRALGALLARSEEGAGGPGDDAGGPRVGGAGGSARRGRDDTGLARGTSRGRHDTGLARGASRADGDPADGNAGGDARGGGRRGGALGGGDPTDGAR